MKLVTILFLGSGLLFGQKIDYSQLKNGPFNLASEFSFTKRNNTNATGDLSSVGSNTISLRGCPAGVNGTDSYHYVYISGGTGTAETVLITGGTCVSESTGGTLQFTTSNSHSGDWTITSATAGIQEAMVALGSNGGEVFIKAGTHSIYAPITIVQSNIKLQGTGKGTILAPINSTMKIIRSSPTLATFNNTIRDLHFKNTTTPVNTNIGIWLWEAFYTTLDNLTFDNIGTGIYLDLCETVRISNVQLVDNSTIFVGSDEAGTGLYSFNVQINNLNHFTWSPSLSLVRPAVLTFSRVINSTVHSFVTQGLFQTYNGIDIFNDCQGVQIFGGVIVAPAVGVNISPSTVDGVFGYPAWVVLSGVAIDQYGTWGVHFGVGVFHNKMIGGSITGNNPALGTEIAGVGFDNLSYGNSVQNVTFHAIAHGNGVMVQPNASDVSIKDNYFYMSSASGANIDVASYTADYLSITGNQRSRYDTSGFFIYNESTATHNLVANNDGIDNIMGPDYPSGDTITPLYPVQRVTGTTAINTIALSPNGAMGSFTGTLTLLPTGVFSLTTSGNIAAACTAVVGKPIVLQYNRVTSLWYPICY